MIYISGIALDELGRAPAAVSTDNGTGIL